MNIKPEVKFKLAYGINSKLPNFRSISSEDRQSILPNPKERQRMSEFQTFPGAVRQNVKKEKTKREKRLDFFEKYHIMVIVLLLTTMK